MDAEVTPALAPRPVRPRDAASLVPLRRDHTGTSVLMGRRARGHRFMPDVYVFPGGRVDAADHRVAAASALRPAVQKRLLTSATAQRAHALAVAAVRETWEETGLAIGENRDGELRPALGRLDYIIRAITPPDMPIRFHARFFTAEIAASDGAVHGNGELLDLAWRSVDECLKLPLADITEFILSHLDELVAGGASGAHAPLFSFRKGKAGLRR